MLSTPELNELRHLLAASFPAPSAMAQLPRLLAWCEEHAATILPRRQFPPLLLETARPPKFLFILGDASVLQRPAVAIVGTRHPSTYGLRAAMKCSRALVKRRLTVVSGLARGIDGAAHRAAIEAGGTTVAILGHGLDRVYPAAHRTLAQDILASGGCLVAEYAPGVAPRPHHFPARNRIIAGLSLGTLVVEAAARSGSLITAREALEANREVFVCPGSFDDGAFSGSHRLIQEGAKLITSIDEIVCEFAPGSDPSPPQALEDSLRPLRELFRRFGDAMDLHRLNETVAEAELAELRVALARACSLGCVTEVLPQQFAWVGHDE